MAVYYNEIDHFAAAWLRELIKAGHLPKGDVDERSISEVDPGDLTGYEQCHFFAGIGGWPYALRLAGVPTDVPIWTGSCPCQPFSYAGNRKGTADERHLWPEFYRIIKQCRPAIVFGEQVASAAALSWWDAVANDLENAGYACAAADLCAASVGSPHVRQRLFWVAHSVSVRFNGRGDCKEDIRLKSKTERSGQSVFNWTPLVCADGKARAVSSGFIPLADGIPTSVGLLRGYGNAIVPQVAAEFIKAVMEIL